MDATTIPSINSTLKTLDARLPDVSFVADEVFSWNPLQRRISYNPNVEYALERLLHESGHAICNHTDYTKDISLLEMERDAWEAARELGQTLGVMISDDIIQDHLDDYRLWLHARSTCPSCQQLGIQDSPNSYACPTCQASWRVNDSRVCQLRRYKK